MPDRHPDHVDLSQEIYDALFGPLPPSDPAKALPPLPTYRMPHCGFCGDDVTTSTEHGLICMACGSSV